MGEKSEWELNLTNKITLVSSFLPIVFVLRKITPLWSAISWVRQWTQIMVSRKDTGCDLLRLSLGVLDLSGWVSKQGKGSHNFSPGMNLSHFTSFSRKEDFCFYTISMLPPTSKSLTCNHNLKFHLPLPSSGVIVLNSNLPILFTNWVTFRRSLNFPKF